MIIETIFGIIAISAGAVGLARLATIYSPRRHRNIRRNAIHPEYEMAGGSLIRRNMENEEIQAGE